MNLRSDTGAATLAAVAMGLVLAFGVAVAGALGRAALAQQKAAAAADLAALSAATAIASLSTAPCQAAARTASGNGADLESCHIAYTPAGPEVHVQVTGRQRVWPMEPARGSARAGLRAAREATAAPRPASPP